MINPFCFNFSDYPIHFMATTEEESQFGALPAERNLTIQVQDLSQFELLPTELVLKIASNLKLRDLYSLCLVSKRMKSVIEKFFCVQISHEDFGYLWTWARTFFEPSKKACIFSERLSRLFSEESGSLSGEKVNFYREYIVGLNFNQLELIKERPIKSPSSNDVTLDEKKRAEKANALILNVKQGNRQQFDEALQQYHQRTLAAVDAEGARVEAAVDILCRSAEAGNSDLFEIMLHSQEIYIASRSKLEKAMYYIGVSGDGRSMDSIIASPYFYECCISGVRGALSEAIKHDHLNIVERLVGQKYFKHLSQADITSFLKQAENKRNSRIIECIKTAMDRLKK